jgi:flagellar biosynthesis protein FlhF
MQIKKYLAPTLKEATLQMKQELGEKAIILGSRTIENDFRSGGKRMFEITIGYDPVNNSQKKVAVEQELSFSKGSFAEEIASLSERVYANQTKEKKQNSEKSFQHQYNAKQTAEVFSIENDKKEIIDTLINREVQKPLISVIMNQLEQYEKFLNPDNIDNYAMSGISSLIPTKNFELQKNRETKVVTVVGPTGVGKTTCIAKLAIIAKLLHNLDVGLISVDTYRLGALDQLRIFSEVSNIDMLIAYEPEEMPGLLNSFKNKDIVFIDTAGRSQKRADQLAKTKRFLDNIKVDETFLALSSTNSTKNLFDTAEKFKVFKYDSFIFTKIDEGVSFGNILNCVTNFNIPISFLSNGQVIPDDIISADSDFISKLIYTGKS